MHQETDIFRHFHVVRVWTSVLYTRLDVMTSKKFGRKVIISSKSETPDGVNCWHHRDALVYQRLSHKQYEGTMAQVR